MYLEKLRLDGRVAVVTGAGQGIGAACARALGEAGATVVVADMAADRAEKTSAELRSKGLKTYAMTLDVTKSKDVDAAAEKIVREHGRVDVLVNNAGVAKSDVRAEDTSDDHWRFHMDVNLDEPHGVIPVPKGREDDVVLETKEEELDEWALLEEEARQIEAQQEAEERELALGVLGRKAPPRRRLPPLPRWSRIRCAIAWAISISTRYRRARRCSFSTS